MDLVVTPNMLLLYGGLAGAGVSLAGALITALLLRRSRRRIAEAVRREYE